MRNLCLPAACLVLACAAPEGKGLMATPPGNGPRVSFDVFHKPLPDIPLPNDFATRFDATSPTKRRLNASQVAPSIWEQRTRQQLDQLDGWGTLAPISVSFDAALDVENIIRRQQKDRLDTHDDVLLVVDVTPGSADFCQAMPMDFGEGYYPLRLDKPTYYPDDPRAQTTNLLFEEVEEDTNRDGVLNPGEDTDMDGVLDHANVRSPTDPTLLTFYERETRTLIVRPLMPLREATTYAVVLTRNLVGEDGKPVRSPFAFVNHATQTAALKPLSERCLERLGFSVADVTFAWSFTTQAWTKPLVAVRDGLYGLGPFKQLATDFSADPTLRSLRTSGPGINTKIVPNEKFLALAKDLFTQLGSGNSEQQADLFFDNFAFIDFHALGTFDSPQFFPRYEEDGKTLKSLSDQVWQLNATTGEALVRHEAVPFWLMVPKRRTGPAPLAIFVHGHGSTKFDALNVAGFLARQGIATLGIDAVSHGVDVEPILLEVVRGQFKQRGLEGMGQGIVDGRAIDQNADGKLDSGADYWTSYIIHTRDVVRQTGVDLFQVVRSLRSFDGVRTWKYDANGDGNPDLAGDFDGDGLVDVGGTAPLHLFGGSLGGILASYVGGLEPAIDTAVAVIGGGGLGDIGTRSTLNGVRDAMVLRMMGPLVLVHDGAVYEMVPDLTDHAEVKIATLASAPPPGSVVVLKNLDTGEWRCGRVQPNGHLRVAVSSDKGNRLVLELYDGELPTKLREGCTPEGTPREVIAHFENEVKFQGATFAAGSDFVALGDGFGMRRGNPEIRRMMGLAQVALEGADPANTAPFLHGDRELVYGNGERVSTRVLYLNTMGDSGVPTSSGITLARAAGLIDFRNTDPRYGKTVQQLLIDEGVVEGVESSRRHLNQRGDPVLIDVENLQNLSLKGGDGFDVPRLNPVLRLIRDNDKAHGGGKSGILFPMMDPRGAHGFPVPEPEANFDLGSLLVNQVGRYLATGGEKLDFDACQIDWSCSWLPPVP